MTFQDPATIAMNNLIDLHHDIMFFLILISIFVAYFLFQILNLFTFDENPSVLPSRVTHNTFLEVIWTLIPSLILFIIAIPSFSLLYTMESQAIWTKPDLTLKVIGHQWYWGYEYESYPEIELRLQTEEELLENFEMDGGFRLLETNSKLILPVDKKIRLLITSDDVIHSWTIPSFAVKVDAVPGRLNQVFLKILRPGIYYGQCSEICGINHGFMPIAIYATSDWSLVDDFAKSSL
jgi:cytochrome c oxidase subunit II